MNRKYNRMFTFEFEDYPMFKKKEVINIESQWHKNGVIINSLLEHTLKHLFNPRIQYLKITDDTGNNWTIKRHVMKLPELSQDTLVYYKLYLV